MRASIAVMCVSLTVGCAMGRDYARPAIDTPVAWQTLVSDAVESAGPLWWRRFQDSQLEALITEALQNNLDLKLALARIEQARAQARMAGAEFYPKAEAKVGSQRSRRSRNDELVKELESLGVTLPGIAKVHTANVEIGYEIDLWGRVRRGTEAAGADYSATVDDARAVSLMLAADIAEAYFDVRQWDESIDLESRLLDIGRTRARLLQARYAAGVVSAAALLDEQVEQAQREVNALDFQRRRAQSLNRLALLLGRNPGTVQLPPASLRASTVVPEVSPGLPSALLEQRPDVRSAEQRLIGANARIGEAKAALFPRIALTGFAGYQSDELKSLTSGKSRVWGYGPQITLPLFEGGRLRARVESARATYDEALNDYRRVVLRAFEEVERALIDRETHMQQQQRLATAADALAALSGRIRAKFEQGSVSRLDVIEAEKSLLTIETQRLALYRAALGDVVTLYKALGNGW